MSLFGRRKSEQRELSDAERRVKTLPAHELPAWAENCVFAVGRTLAQYTRQPDLDMLVEARLAADTLVVVLQEMEIRAANPWGEG